MQVAIKEFIDVKWGSENFYPPILNTVGNITLARAFLGSVNSIGSPDFSSLSEVKIEHLHSGMESRRLYRESLLASLAVAVWNVAEAIIYLPVAGVAFVALDDVKFLNLAKKSIVQGVVNCHAAMVAFIGQFAPTYAGKIYALAIKLLLKLEPRLFQICYQEYSRDIESQRVIAGIEKCFNLNPEQRALETVWGATTMIVTGAETQMDVISNNLAAVANAS